MPISRLLPASFEQPNPKNLIINGNMGCSQRGSVSKTTNSWGYTLDRWELSNYIDDTITVTQDSDAPSGTGLGNSMKITGSSGDNSLDASDYLSMVTKLEGQDLQVFNKGTSSAVPMTFSFWIKTTTTGTYILEFADNDNTRKISKSYTVSASNQWEYKSITIDADTTGTLDDDNNNSLWIQLWFAAGANFTGGGSLNSSWTSGTSVNTRVKGQVNGMSSGSHNIYITGVCLNVGSKSISGNDGKSFPHESFAETLNKCSRYYHRITWDNDNNRAFPSYCQNSTSAIATHTFPVPMRTRPTAIETNGTATDYDVARINTITVCSAVPSYNEANIFRTSMVYTTAGSLTAGEGGQCRLRNDSGSYLAWSAEL